MRDDFSFTCPNPNCEMENSVNRTSSGEPIPRYDDNPKEFYVTCPHCFGIFKIEYIVVVTEMMKSNFVPKNNMSVTGVWFDEFKDYPKED